MSGKSRGPSYSPWWVFSEGLDSNTVLPVEEKEGVDVRTDVVPYTYKRDGRDTFSSTPFPYKE